MLIAFRSKIGPAVRRYLEFRAKKKIMKNQMLWSSLEKVISPSTGCQYSDYWQLYSYVRANKPSEVLELGSGISTMVIALALKENGNGRVTSMEESDYYLQATRRLLSEDLLQFVDIRFSPAVPMQWGPFYGTCYEEIPKRNYSLVFVDGPQYDPINSFDGDFIKVVSETGTRPIDAIIDSRTETCFIYNEIFGRKFSFDYIRRTGFIKGAVAKDVSSFPAAVHRAMARHLFRRHIFW